MELIFERGRADAPAGHALVYFTSPSDGATLATYLVVLPIVLELSKYVPPMLAAQMPIPDTKNVGAVPLPPVPEAVESVSYLEHLADLRRDDLLSGGQISANDVTRAMMAVGEIAQRYAQAYEEFLSRSPSAPKDDESGQSSESTVNDVLYGLMSEQQKLAELAKIASQLRYAVDGRDQRQIDDLTEDLTRLGRQLPSVYNLASFIDALKRPGPEGEKLSALYLERCYKLSNEDYAALARVDKEIEQLRSSL